MQAQSLHNSGGLFLQFSRHIFKGIGRKKLSAVPKRFDLTVALLNIFSGNISASRVFFLHNLKYVLAAMLFKHTDNIVGNIIHRVNGAGADIQNDIVAAQLILMNHFMYLLYPRLYLRKNAADFGGILQYAILLAVLCALALLVCDTAAGLAGRLA